MNVQPQSTDLDQFLVDLAGDARPGDRVPPIRELMRRFGASQMVVERAIRGLKDRGLVAAHVGRGTYFQGAGTNRTTATREAPSGSAAKSVLLLRRSISIARGRVVMDGLQRRFAAEGHRVLEVSYTAPDDARSILKGLPRFDACVVQSSFKIITIDLLAALREKCAVLAVDGATLAGTDVEAVGMEWGEPIAVATALLQRHGHRNIACAMTTQPFLASQLGKRRLEELQRSIATIERQAIGVPNLPGDDDYEAALVKLIGERLDAAGRLPFSALIAWGIEDGARFRRLMSDIGVAIPATLSMVLLGRTDLVNEHDNFFDTVGCAAADQIEHLYLAVTQRWLDPSRPYGVRLIPVTGKAGASIAAPASGAGRADRKGLQELRKPRRAA